MGDVNRIFHFIEQPRTGMHFLKDCRYVLPSPHFVKKEMLRLIEEEIKQAKKEKNGFDHFKDEFAFG
jgi:polyphosphate kinase